MKILLFLHVLGAILFLGNIIVTAFWKVFINKSKDLQAIHIAARKVMAADYAFTIPGLLLIIITGNVMAYKLGYAMNELHWVSLSNWLFALTGVIWGALLLPLQAAMIRHSGQSIEKGGLTDKYKKAYKYWMIFGTVATVIPVVILYLMTVKPF